MDDGIISNPKEDRMKKLMLAALVLLPLYYFLHPASALCAETKEIISEGTYIMGDGETPIVAESRAIEQAKRSAVEQAGTYVKSYTQVKNFQIEKDEIEVLASGLVEISILDKKRTLEADAIKFWVKIRAIVTPDKIGVTMERIRENGLAQEFAEIKAAYDKSQAELAKLKEQLAATKADQEHRDIVARITVQEKDFQSRLLYADAMSDFAAGRLDEALEKLMRSVADSPAFSEAYLLRGFVYLKQGKHDKAITDLDRVIALKPDLARAYAGRGICYSIKNQHKAAIADLTKALLLNPGFPQDLESVIHGHLGRSLFEEKQFQQAKDHLLIACKTGDKPYCKILQLPRFRNPR
jgi:tetratricopeptide (TPR) repeat protein